MLEYLCAVSDNTRWNRFWDYLNHNDKLGMGVATAQALERRGMIRDRYKDRETGEYLMGADLPNVVRPKLPNGQPDLEERYELTPAGKLVVELVLLAGLFVESDAAFERKAQGRA